MQTMKLIDLMQYRRDLISEHEAKLAAIDVLLGKSTDSGGVNQLQKRNGKRPKGYIVGFITEALSKVPAQFTVDQLFEAIQIGHAAENIKRWDVIHALWRMEKQGEFFVPEAHKGQRPKTYEKKEKRGVNEPTM